MDKLDNEVLFKSLYESSIVWCEVLNGAQVPNKRLWRLSNGYIEALLWNNKAIAKTGLSFLARDGTYRVGLNIYVHNPMIPDGSFAVLLAQQDEVSFIGGVLELFPTVSIEEDIAGFRAALNKIAQKYKMDSDHLRQGLEGAFTIGEEGSNLGAVAGFNLYRAGLEVTSDNLNFAQETFMKALEEYQAIIDKRKHEVKGSVKAKAYAWQKHLHFMKEKDIGIKMALEQGLPMDFFEYSTFPPVQ